MKGLLTVLNAILIAFTIAAATSAIPLLEYGLVFTLASALTLFELYKNGNSLIKYSSIFLNITPILFGLVYFIFKIFIEERETGDQNLPFFFTTAFILFLTTPILNIIYLIIKRPTPPEKSASH